MSIHLEMLHVLLANEQQGSESLCCQQIQIGGHGLQAGTFCALQGDLKYFVHIREVEMMFPIDKYKYTYTLI